MVVICSECESVLIPVDANVEIEIAYEPSYDFRKHFLDCELCPNCMRLIRTEEYKESLQPIIEDIIDIMKTHDTLRPKIKFINIKFNKNDYIDYKKKFALKALLEEYVFSDLKYVSRTGDVNFLNTIEDDEIKRDKVESVERFLSTIRSMMNQDDTNLF